MTLPTHSAFGMLIAFFLFFLPWWIIAPLAYLSHYLLDAVEHWEKNQSLFLKNSKQRLQIATLIELLVATGLYAIIWLRGFGEPIVLVSAIVACLPDAWHVHSLLFKFLPFHSWHEHVHWWQGNPKKKNEGPPVFQALFVGGFLIFILTRG